MKTQSPQPRMQILYPRRRSYFLVKSRKRLSLTQVCIENINTSKINLEINQTPTECIHRKMIVLRRFSLFQRKKIGALVASSGVNPVELGARSSCSGQIEFALQEHSQGLQIRQTLPARPSQTSIPRAAYTPLYFSSMQLPGILRQASGKAPASWILA